MAKAKEERNKEFIAAWKEEGLTDRELQDKFNLSPGGVKGLKSRLRKKDPSLYTEREVDKSRSPQIKKSRPRQVDKSIKLQDKGIGKYKPVTFRISEETEWQLKALAVNRREQVSELVREIFNDYLSRNR